MFLERWVQGFEQRMTELSRRLWQTDPRTRLREDVLQASEELRDRHQALSRCRAELDTMRLRINENHAAIVVLPGRIQDGLARGASEQAWRDALQLDQARKQLAADQARLPQQEHLSDALELQVRFLTRRLARLQEQLNPSA